MLQEMYINNFVLIDELRLLFAEGLNVLSGETGAGKSIIIDALGLIMGERIKGDFIRDEQKKAVAEAVFDLSANPDARSFLMDNNLLEEDEDSIIISRDVSPNGRNSARINGRNVTAGMLKNLAPLLLDMHLQHDQQGILRPDMYLDFVDNFAPGTSDVLANMIKVYTAMKTKKQELKEIEANEQERMKKIDYLCFQIKEIEQAALQPGEEEELLLIRKRIRNAQSLMEGTQKLLHLLYSREYGESANDLISAALETSRSLKDDYFSDITPRLEEIYYALQDMSGDLSSFRDSLDFEAGVLEETEERLHMINRLKTKYAQNIAGILQVLDISRNELGVLQNHQDIKEQLEKSIDELDREYLLLAGSLTEFRKQGAASLEEKVHSELEQLNMPHVKFVVVLQKRETPGVRGLDRVEFMFSPNPGEELRPLSKIASGGEISRFVLALKKALAEVYNVPTLIFDEIDVGVGGTALNAMARKLYEISRNHQVILVTHSAQVAGYADQHYLIEKKMSEDKTHTTVKELTDNERIREIARMMAGENYSALSLEHAREILESSRLF
ncbi:MAG: DNA repair protein RecN [Syntrophomonadaceae bacterium]|nr:DNA repair protein RecN [Syntrophomonadaceae bacterium]MDD3023267.1 DNA repair protein RecN [Syntrophomonadaceae bacterium]